MCTRVEKSYDERKQRGWIRRPGVWAVLVAAALGLSACGTYSGNGSYASLGNDSYKEAAAEDYDTGYGLDTQAYREGEAAGGEEGRAALVEESQAVSTDRKLIRTVNLTVETQGFDQLMKTLDERVRTLEGYVENMSSYNGGGYWNGADYIADSRNASLTLRIPRQKLDTFLADLNQLGHVTSRVENTEDVTLTYVDLKSHKLALETEQTRLLALLERAESVDDIISIESRLSQVRYEIGSMESQLRTYDNKVDYATVYIEIIEVKTLTPVEEPGAWERISQGFAGSVKNVLNGWKEFAIWLIVSLPYLLVWALIICILVLIIRYFIRKAAKKRAEPAGTNPYRPQPGQVPADTRETNYQSQNGDNHGTGK